MSVSGPPGPPPGVPAEREGEAAFGSTNAPARELVLGGRRYDIRHRALVMGILNRTPDSFYDRGSYYDFDKFLRRAADLVAAGADLLDVGGVKAGPGEEVTEEAELERVVPAIAALRARFDCPISVDTWRSAVAREAFAAGAVLGNDISGFADPDYLAVAAAAGAGVVATHIRLRPRVADPEPVYLDVVAEVAAYLRERVARALAAGVGAESIVVDAGLDLGKTTAHSLALLGASDRLAALGHPLLLSASNKTFLGVLLGLEVHERREASLAAAAVGVSLGCRILRVHDVAGTKRVVAALEGVLAARDGAAPADVSREGAAP
jgi:dihydropteroate synthase